MFEFLLFYFVFSGIVIITYFKKDNSTFIESVFYGLFFGFIMFPIAIGNVIHKILTNK